MPFCLKSARFSFKQNAFFIFFATTAGLGTALLADRAVVFFFVVFRTVFFFATT